jgi:hypothetical protein
MSIKSVSISPENWEILQAEKENIRKDYLFNIGVADFVNALIFLFDSDDNIREKVINLILARENSRLSVMVKKYGRGYAKKYIGKR